ncbi:23.6 kDa heat shock protein, mitochondrial [Tanacetum coccineum]|uniref:23.6 kDa heat shock protein, mitochondrial n=1 Tax=Tanacetum coccineum TaxID=301880 RepID=A0ABQ5ARM2_9ASTR
MQCSLWNKDISTIIVGMKSVEQFLGDLLELSLIKITFWGLLSHLASFQSCSMMGKLASRRSSHTKSDVGDEEITPVCDMHEDDENRYLSIHMPRLNKGDVKSKIKDKHISCSGGFSIPEYVKGSGILGEMKDGEWTITLPKLKEGGGEK